MSTKIKIGIVGGAGYTGGELLRILVNHPNADIVFVHSNSNAGNPIYKVHTDLIGSTDIVFNGELSSAIDVLFLCVGHGDALKFLQANPIESHIKIIDLSQDFRIEKEGNDFIYGLPEMQREQIKTAKHIANPGCFATAIQMGLLPLAAEKVLTSDVHVSGITGSTGAGQSLSQTSHFSWRNNNMSVYKALDHQHLKEIRQSLKNLQSSLDVNIHFIPYRGDFTRGIIATMYTPCEWTLDEAKAKYKSYYASHPFTHVVDENIDLKQVVNTNNCLLYLEKHGNQLMIVSIIDNLLKGASGHAVQNMNLMFGLEETTGLRLKAASF
jgi:N-acetyl-gamma-glutamyl-phosphate reductase